MYIHIYLKHNRYIFSEEWKVWSINFRLWSYFPSSLSKLRSRRRRRRRRTALRLYSSRELAVRRSYWTIECRPDAKSSLEKISKIYNETKADAKKEKSLNRVYSLTVSTTSRKKRNNSSHEQRWYPAGIIKCSYLHPTLLSTIFHFLKYFLWRISSVLRSVLALKLTNNYK